LAWSALLQADVVALHGNYAMHHKAHRWIQLVSDRNTVAATGDSVMAELPQSARAERAHW
jgi:hypothetical protein